MDFSFVFNSAMYSRTCNYDNIVLTHSIFCCLLSYIARYSSQIIYAAAIVKHTKASVKLASLVLERSHYLHLGRRVSVTYPMEELFVWTVPGLQSSIRLKLNPCI